jgi:hypothetical protein
MSVVSVEVLKSMFCDIVVSAKKLLLLLLRPNKLAAGMAILAGLTAPLAQGAWDCNQPLQYHAYEVVRHVHNTVLAYSSSFAVPAKDVCRRRAYICPSPHKQARAKTFEDVDHLPLHLNNGPHNGMADYQRHGDSSPDDTLSSHTNI